MAFLPLDARAFQIVATLGPASIDRARDLADAGATSFRINASHVTPEEAAAAVARVRAELPGAPIVIDLQGAKMRLGVFAERAIAAGDTVRFSLHPAGPAEIPLPHRELFAAVRDGDTLSCDDDRLRFRVERVSESALEAAAITGGPLRPRKGVNVVEHPVVLRDLPDHDRAFLDALAGVGDLAWAFSFMKDGSEARWLRERVEGPVVGKIEHPDAVSNLGWIDVAVDAIWICRGDLGAQLGMARLARFVAELDPWRMSCPILMAGQVLEHLTAHAEPTRSEVCHLYDLVDRGFTGIVLSDETAVGHDPAGAVRHAAALVRAFSLK